MIAWIAFGFTATGILFNARKSVWCWPIWIISNFFWVWHTITQGETGPILLTWMTFLFFNVYGWYKWQMEIWEQEEKEELENFYGN